MVDERTPSPGLPTRTEAEGATADLPEGLGFFTTGQILGERYEILEMLGRGGMGEVWRAFDLKLRVEVGLKALREELFQSERRLELLRQEVRAAREVVSPNVCRIFDLIEIDGRELVSMEYVDGATLLGVLQERGPLELKEAQDIASQFLAGIEAIHKAGLVHRDVKPENIMLTRAGRVVVMDFGLARGPESGAGSVSGTPAYMAPEHAAGQDVDARADVYSAGVVLAEMVSPDGIKSYASRQSVWEGVRSEPAQVPDSPWAPVIKRAVARDRERRQNSAHTLIRELEDVTLRVEGADDLHPYPGLASFTEEDAEYFFGREAEIEQMWRRLEGPPRVFGIMGPSGAGKTSFIRAGLTPNVPSNWAMIRCTPGNAAIPSLRGSLTLELVSGSDALQALVTDPENPDVIVDAVRTWREGRTGALLIVDQFEELFTLNSKDEQRRFAALLGRLPLETDVHVVVSMRDDFAAACGTHEALRPVFHELTVLQPPTGGNLRRALVQPAGKCGYRFEDDDLTEEILAEVEGERGAMPLLAFALARLWEDRDRERGFLTRQAYYDIGGVGGALARHAEATVDRIGVERIPVVRELFRNLVTAEGTRAVREWDELLSVFETDAREGVNPSPTKNAEKQVVGAGLIPARATASEVLSELIDARLLTSYEIREDEREPIRRVEIIHESLLTNWPRLVRWQTQDQEGAQLRDELRQAARAWNEHGRHEDRLWTGTAYREFRLWQERYPGSLTATEAAFAAAITSLAGRRRRRRRIAAVAALVFFASVATVFGWLWRRSVLQERRAEAANLIALGQLELDSYPSATIAHAIASLEESDGPSARILALEALWKGPAAIIVNDVRTAQAQFTSDGRWLIQSQSNAATGPLRLIGADGSSQILERTKGGHAARREIGFESGIFGLQGWADEGKTSTASVWSAPEKTRLVEARYGPGAVMGWNLAIRSNQRRMTVAIREKDGRVAIDALGFDGNTSRLGTIDLDLEVDEIGWLVDMNRRGQWVAASTGHDIYVIEVGDRGLSDPLFLGRQESGVTGVGMDERGRFVATTDAECRIRLWDLDGTSPAIQVEGPPQPSKCGLQTAYGLEDLLVAIVSSSMESELRADQLWIWSVLAEEPKLLRRIDYDDWGGYCLNATHWVKTGPDPKTRLWPLAAPADAEPIELLRGEIGHLGYPRIHPGGEWLVVPDIHGLSLWPLARTYPAVIRRHHKEIQDLEFGPEGRWLASSSTDGTVGMWPLTGEAPPPGQILLDDPTTWFYGLARSPDGSQLSVSDGGILLLSLDEDPPVTAADRVADHSGYWNTAFSADGHRLTSFSAEDGKIRVWDVASREQAAVLTAGESRFSANPQFIDSNHLMALDNSGLHRWKIDIGESDLLVEGTFQAYDVSEDRRRVLLLEAATEDDLGQAVFVDLETGETTALESHGRRVYEVALDTAGRFVVTADRDGVIRVGPITGEEPHLLFGHENSVTALAVDPEGRWIASGSEDETVRLWPMPDLTKPPLHTLPREELIAKLKTLTNLRVVRDPESSTGWKLTHDPFPGWETVPTW